MKLIKIKLFYLSMISFSCVYSLEMELDAYSNNAQFSSEQDRNLALMNWFRLNMPTLNKKAQELKRAHLKRTISQVDGAPIDQAPSKRQKIRKED